MLTSASNKLLQFEYYSSMITSFCAGPGIMTGAIRAEQHGAELVTRRIQELVQATPVHVGMRGRQVKITVAYSSLTFAPQSRSGSVTISGSLASVRQVLLPPDKGM